MKVQTISVTQSCKGISDKKEIAQPKFVCATCVKLSNNNECPVFQRPVAPDYNKCFYHSNYQPIVVIFKPIKDLDTMVDDGKRKGFRYA